MLLVGLFVGLSLGQNYYLSREGKACAKANL
jgi:hypothetical protein